MHQALRHQPVAVTDGGDHLLRGHAGQMIGKVVGEVACRADLRTALAHPPQIHERIVTARHEGHGGQAQVPDEVARNAVIGGDAHATELGNLPLHRIHRY